MALFIDELREVPRPSSARPRSHNDSSSSNRDCSPIAPLPRDTLGSGAIIQDMPSTKSLTDAASAGQLALGKAAAQRLGHSLAGRAPAAAYRPLIDLE